MYLNETASAMTRSMPSMLSGSAINSIAVLLLCAAAVHAQTPPIKLAILGDSLAAGYGLKPEQALPVRLEAVS